MYRNLYCTFFTALTVLVIKFPVSVITDERVDVTAFNKGMMPCGFPILRVKLFVLMLFKVRLVLSM